MTDFSNVTVKAWHERYLAKPSLNVPNPNFRNFHCNSLISKIICALVYQIWIFAPKLVCIRMSKSAGYSNFRNSDHEKIKNLLAHPAWENRNCFVFSEKTFIKVLSRGLSQVFLVTRICFYVFSLFCRTTHCVVAPTAIGCLGTLRKSIFHALLQKTRWSPVMQLFSTLFYWWLKTLHQKTCQPVIIFL